MGAILSRLRPITGLAATVGALLMALPATSIAELRWQPVQEIADGPSVMGATVAVDARGDALAMWLEQRAAQAFELRYSWRTPHGAWGAPRSLPLQLLSTGFPTFAVSPRGIATAVYRLADGRVGIATGKPGEALSLTQALGAADPLAGNSFSTLAMDDEGGASFGWSASNGEVLVATRRPGRRFRAPQQLATDSVGVPPKIAVNNAGAAVVAWLGQQPLKAHAAYRLPGAAAFGPAEDVPVALSPFSTFVDEAYSAGAIPELAWSDVGPGATETKWGSYRHDNAVSVSWSMTGAPRGEVQSSVLEKLLSPHPEIARKRVTLIYQTMDSAVAARTVENDKRNADFRATGSPRPTARAIREQRAAHLTATEEARGAGLVNFGMIVTATALDEDQLPDVEAAIDNLAATARIQLRPVYGSQDSAFAAGLPLGLVLPKHLKVPAEIRAAL